MWFKPSEFLPLNEASPKLFANCHIPRASKKDGAMICDSRHNLTQISVNMLDSFEVLCMKPILMRDSALPHSFVIYSITRSLLPLPGGIC